MYVKLAEYLHMTISADLHDYFYNTVKPTVNEFLADKTNIRKARVAAIVLYHMHDYVKEDNVANASYRNMKGRIALMRDAVRAAANATKHRKLTSPHIASTAQQVSASNHPGLFQAPFGVGVFAEANYVHLVLDEVIDGSKTISMVEAIESLQNFWDDYLLKSV